jgi:hypothetical protein
VFPAFSDRPYATYDEREREREIGRDRESKL